MIFDFDMWRCDQYNIANKQGFECCIYDINISN